MMSFVGEMGRHGTRQGYCCCDGRGDRSACIENDEFCIKHDDICIENDEFCITIVEFAGGRLAQCRAGSDLHSLKLMNSALKLMNSVFEMMTSMQTSRRREMLWCFSFWVIMLCAKMMNFAWAIMNFAFKKVEFEVITWTGLSRMRGLDTWVLL